MYAISVDTDVIGKLSPGICVCSQNWITASCLGLVVNENLRTQRLFSLENHF